MTIQTLPPTGLFATATSVALRRIVAEDLPQIARFPFTVSIREPLDDSAALSVAFEASGLWGVDAGAAAIVEAQSGRLLGTTQFYRSAPCIHGYEIGYIIHDPADRGGGVGRQALRLMVDHLFSAADDVFRLQLIIETWNVASWKLAERCGFVREGLLRSAGFGSGDPADCFLYAMTRKDWREGQHRPPSLGG